MDRDNDNSSIELVDPDRKRIKLSQSSTDLSLMEGSFINLVVRLGDMEDKGQPIMNFVRLLIPMTIVSEMLDEIRRDSAFNYKRHQHGYTLMGDACSLDLVDVPFTATFPEQCLIVASASVVYCFINCCSTYFFCDFSQSLPKWEEAATFPSSFPIDWFDIMNFDGKLFGLGFNGSSEEMSGKIFDPSKRSWEDVTLPIVMKKSDLSKIRVASAGPKMLLLDLKNEFQYEYDPQLLRWNSTHHQGLQAHFGVDMLTPITVEEEKTMYWLDKEGNIKAFDWARSKFYMGPIIGFDYDPLKRPGLCFMTPFLHLEKELFCVIWMEDFFILHNTIIRVSRDTSCETPSDSVHFLYAAVVDCLHYRMNSKVEVDGAYKLG